MRSPREFQAVHASGARNLPLDRLDPEHLADLCGGAKERPVLILCQGGTRAKAASRTLDAAGFTAT